MFERDCLNLSKTRHLILYNTIMLLSLKKTKITSLSQKMLYLTWQPPMVSTKLKEPFIWIDTA